MSLQKTIKQPAVTTGRGLFGGRQCRLQFLAAPVDSGIVFVRTDLGEPARIAASIENVLKQPRRTCLQNGSASVETVEHVLAAASGLGISNLVIEIDGPEPPSTDGSAQPFVEALQQAGIEPQKAPTDELVISEHVTPRESGHN